MRSEQTFLTCVALTGIARDIVATPQLSKRRQFSLYYTVCPTSALRISYCCVGGGRAAGPGAHRLRQAVEPAFPANAVGLSSLCSQPAAVLFMAIGHRSASHQGSFPISPVNGAAFLGRESLNEINFLSYRVRKSFFYGDLTHEKDAPRK